MMLAHHKGRATTTEGPPAASVAACANSTAPRTPKQSPSRRVKSALKVCRGLRLAHRRKPYRYFESLAEAHLLGSINALITRPEATCSSASFASDSAKLWSCKRVQGADRTASLMIWVPR